MAAAVGAVAGADSSDDPHAAASNVTRTTLTPTAKRIDRRPGPHFPIGSFRRRLINTEVRSIGSSPPHEPESNETPTHLVESK